MKGYFVSSKEKPYLNFIFPNIEDAQDYRSQMPHVETEIEEIEIAVGFYQCNGCGSQTAYKEKIDKIILTCNEGQHGVDCEFIELYVPLND